jgi:pimeloyl-ACP methyl ester carboxylesterase
MNRMLLPSWFLIAVIGAAHLHAEDLGEDGFADGLQDWALLPGALNDTWKWLEKDLTLVTIPWSGHFVQQDAAEFVTKTMVRWLTQ